MHTVCFDSLEYLLFQKVNGQTLNKAQLLTGSWQEGHLMFIEKY